MITELIERAGKRIEILPGGGIRALNVREMMERTGCRQVHMTAWKAVTDTSTRARPEDDVWRGVASCGGSFSDDGCEVGAAAGGDVEGLAFWWSPANSGFLVASLLGMTNLWKSPRDDNILGADAIFR